MIKTLQYIAENYGTDVLRDGSKLIAFYSDLAPRQKRERQMLEFFVKCNGNNKLLDALHRSPKEQEACVRVLVEQMSTQLLMSEDAAYAVCENFWTAIGGTPLPPYLIPEPSPSPQPAPNPTPKPIKPWIIAVPIFAIIISILLSSTNTSAIPKYDSSPQLDSITTKTDDDAKSATDTKRLTQIVSSWDGDESNTYLYYNADGLLERVSFAGFGYDRGDYVYEYDSEGRLKKVETGSRIENIEGYMYVELFYDAEGRLATLKRFSPGYGDGQISYVYDENSKIMHELINWTHGNTYNVFFTYENNLLVKVGNTTYQYDELGRIVSSMASYDHGNGQTESYTETYSYDYPSFVFFLSEYNDISGYYDLGYFADLDPHIRLSLGRTICAPFHFGPIELYQMTADEDGYLAVLEGRTNQGENKLRYEFIYEE